MSNFVDNANATALMGAVEESIANTRIFPGTLDEYDALPPEEKAKYRFIATPDNVIEDVSNVVADGDMRPVTSNAVYGEIQDIKNDLGNTKLKTIEISNVTIADGETKTIDASSYLPSGAKIKGVLSCKLSSYSLPYVYHGTSTIIVRTWVASIGDTSFTISCSGTSWNNYVLTAVIAYE